MSRELLCFPVGDVKETKLANRIIWATFRWSYRCFKGFPWFKVSSPSGNRVCRAKDVQHGQ